MFKKTLYTVMMTSIFASMPAMAGDESEENRTNHPATEMEGSHDPRAAKEMEKHAEKYEDDLTDEGYKKTEEWIDEESTNHPAAKMDESVDPRAAMEMEEHAQKYEDDLSKPRPTDDPRAAVAMEKHAEKYEDDLTDKGYKKTEEWIDEESTNHPASEMEDSVDPRAATEMEEHAEKYEEDLTD